MPHAFRAAVVALSLSIAPFAAAAESAAFMTFGFGSASFDTHDKRFDGRPRFGFEAAGGYRWQVAGPWAIGVEAGLADLGTVTHRVADPAAKPAVIDRARPASRKPRRKPQAQVATYLEKSRLSVDSLLVGINARWSIAEQWSLTGRAGMARHHATVESRTPTSKHRASARSWQPYVGLGGAFALTPDADFTLAANQYHFAGPLAGKDRQRTRVVVLSAGLETRF
ncbi:MAG: outer membrane beta-barrel protein [Luteibacter sp.]